MSRRQILLAIPPVAVILVLALYVLALRELRRLESDYIAIRRPSACATSTLVRFGDELDENELANESARLIQEAKAQIDAAKRRFDQREGGFPLPQLKRARASVALAASAQQQLFVAMSQRPGDTTEELERFVIRNTQAERDMTKARRFLLAPKHRDWDTRAEC